MVPTSTPTPTSTALRSFEATRDDDARYDGQFEPITFYTMLPMRVERILNLTSPSEHFIMM